MDSGGCLETQSKISLINKYIIISDWPTKGIYEILVPKVEPGYQSKNFYCISYKTAC